MNFAKILIAIRLLNTAFRRYRLKILAMAVAGFIGGLLGGVGVVTVIPLFSFVVKEQSGASDAITRLIERMIVFVHLSYNLRTLLILIALLFAIKAVFMYFATYLTARITADYERTTRNELFSRTLRAQWIYLLEQKLGHLETVLVTDVSRGGEVLSLLSATMLFTTTLLAYSIIALSISPWVTLITLTLGLIIFFALKPLLYRTRKVSQQWARDSKSMANQVAEYMVGTKTIKASGMESGVLAKIQLLFNQLRESRIRLAILNSLQISFQEPMSLLLVVGIFVFSYHRPDFNFASFVAVIYLVQKMFVYMQAIQGRLSGINETAPFLKTVLNFEEQAAKHVESDTMGTKQFIFNDSFGFHNIEFGYNRQKLVLNDVSFAVNRGEMIGLIGPSGSGKTTIVDLMLKLFEPNVGAISIDGVKISDISTNDWRRNIGYVSQDIFLLSDTIENNIRFYDASISDKDIVEAARMANIYDVIQEQPEKFKAIVGERGVKFSVGQRQRIVLARALARKPKILILDEATSALDNESESLIQKTLEELKQKTTIVIIAHRLSTVMSCDRLIALEDGKIVEQGSPSQLRSNTDSYFYKTYELGRK